MDGFLDGLEAQMSEFAEQEQMRAAIAELRRIAADEGSGPGHDFACGWATAALKLTGNE
jgi:hypothetical protein